MKKGDIILCNLSGDYGKTRPALIVQSDLFNPIHASIVICPITSHIVQAPLFRINIENQKEKNLIKDSQIMVDKIMAIKRDKITKKIGMLSGKEMAVVNGAIRLWLNLG